MKLIKYFLYGVKVTISFAAWIIGLTLPLFLAFSFNEWWLMLYLISIPLAVTVMLAVEDNLV